MPTWWDKNQMPLSSERECAVFFSRSKKFDFHQIGSSIIFELWYLRWTDGNRAMPMQTIELTITFFRIYNSSFPFVSWFLPIWISVDFLMIELSVGWLVQWPKQKLLVSIKVVYCAISDGTTINRFKRKQMKIASDKIQFDFGWIWSGRVRI